MSPVLFKSLALGNTQNASPVVEQLLAKLHGPALPQAIDWWPLAPGWWALIVTVTLCIAALVILLRRYRHNNRYRKLALLRLFDLKKVCSENELGAALNTLLKRTFISAYPNTRHVVAAKLNQDWLNILHKTCDLSGCAENQLAALAALTGDGKYQPDFTLATQDAMSICQFWIKRHKHLSTSKLRVLLALDPLESAVPKSTHEKPAIQAPAVSYKPTTKAEVDAYV